MKKNIIAATIMSLTLAVAGSAFAQDHGHDDHGGPQQGHGDDHGDNHDNHGDNHGGPGQGRNDRQNYQAHNDNHGGPRGAGPNHDMRRGGRLPSQYRGNQYVVNDWQGHHLNRPPRGQHWVQTGGDYVLVAIATGVIANVLLNN